MIASRRLASLPLLLAGLAPLAWMPRALQLHAGPGAVPSARPASFLHAVSFALLALGGALLWSAPAEAQTATVLISNTGQTSLMTPWALNSTIPKRAQAFTTGAHTAGYTVSSIGISFAGISRVPGSGVRGRGSGERETTASSLAGKQQAREKEDNGGQGKDGPAGAIAQGGNGR